MCIKLGRGRLVQVRGFLADFFADADPDLSATAVLVVDTMLTRAYPAPVRLQIQRRDRGRVAWVEVSGWELPAPWTPTPRSAFDSMQRRIFDKACTNWGTVPGEPGHTVWAELRLQPVER